MINENLLLKMNIQEIFRKYPFIVEIFNEHSLECGGCTFSEKVTLEEVLETSKLSSEKIIQEIVVYLECESRKTR